MSLLQLTEELSKKYNIRPSRSKGQNFLIDESAYEAMIEAAQLSGQENILEVGPGLGFLTQRLAQRAQKVFAVELDDKVAVAVRNRLQEEGITNVAVFNEDILNFTSTWVQAIREIGPFIVVANLPYNISSFFLRKFISRNEGNLLPERLTLMLQKEVGERLVAQPGDMSLLAVSVQFYTVPKIFAQVPATSFWPAPQVGSVVVTFERHDNFRKKLAALNVPERIFFRLVKVGFSARRKMLKANLASGLRLPSERILEALAAAQVSGSARAQELSVENWLQLIAILAPDMV